MIGRLRCWFSRFSIVDLMVVMVWMVVCRLKVCRFWLFVLWLVKICCMVCSRFWCELMGWLMIRLCVFFSVWWIFLLLGILLMLVWLVLLVRISRLCVKKGVCVLLRLSSMLLCLVMGMMCSFLMMGVEVMGRDLVCIDFVVVDDGFLVCEFGGLECGELFGGVGDDFEVLFE